MSAEVEINDSIDEPEHGRRDLLSKAAIVTAVAAVVGLSSSNRASAVDGDPVNVGGNETGTTSTRLSGGSALVVTDGNSHVIATKRASIVGVQTVANRVGVMGHATGTIDGWAIYGLNASSGGLGVYGRNVGSGGIGVFGEHAATTSGVGVRGVSQVGVGVEGSGSTFDLRAYGSGRLILNAAGVPNPPANGTVGTVARDAAGNMWVAVAANTWRKIAGPATPAAFHAITPTCVYDSRSPAPAPGNLGSGTNRTISVADGRDLTSGAVSLANVVPVGATAIACNVTVADTASQGFLAVNPGGNTTVSASTINWSASGQVLANGIIATLNATRELTIIAGGGGSTNFIIDVNGYFQ